MHFDLTDSIADLILNSMENQTSELLFDCKTQTVVSANPKNQITANQRFVSLPKWTSEDGFKIRQDFVSSLYAPIAKDDLQRVLHSGRGVFKNFKNCLKQYPEVEKKWHLFKRRTMLIKINEWYNALREVWGLEALSLEPEDFGDEQLVQDAFTFCEYNSFRDKELILRNASAELFCYEQSTELEEVSNSLYFLWERQFLTQDSNLEFGFICKTFSDEFAGCITFQKCPNKSAKIVTMSAFFVLQNFRGLGIGKSLLSKSLDFLQKRKIQWILIANIIVPDAMIPLLTQFGFEKLGSGFVAKLF